MGLRPHRITVGLYGDRSPADGGAGDGSAGEAASSGELARLAAYPVDVVGAVTPIPQAIGAPAPALVVVDDEDLTFAKVRLDEVGAATARARLGDVRSSLTRAILWGALWNDCRDARLSAADYVAFVLDQAPREGDVALVATALENALAAARRYTPEGEVRTEALRRITRGCGERLADEGLSPDHRLAWARAFASASLSSDVGVALAWGLLRGQLDVPGLIVGPQLRWQLLRGLAATAHAGEDDLARERSADATSLAPVRHRAALASLPTVAAKRAAWDELTGGTTLTNDLVTAIAEGFSTPGQGHLRAAYVAPYFAGLTDLWASRSQELAQRVVAGLFPTGIPRASGISVPDEAARWLADHPDAPRALRRIVVELRDDTVRAAAAQRAFPG